MGCGSPLATVEHIRMLNKHIWSAPALFQVLRRRLACTTLRNDSDVFCNWAWLCAQLQQLAQLVRGVVCTQPNSPSAGPRLSTIAFFSFAVKFRPLKPWRACWLELAPAAVSQCGSNTVHAVRHLLADVQDAQKLKSGKSLAGQMTSDVHTCSSGKSILATLASPCHIPNLH